ncbi:Crp/Fnr family transcriptional regulator [Lysinibacillus endophyticus]|uniref:Crp/Fnr family transcriptional regulator n=1 Tax=Ureibacillus endophyticus TaxID=1978490 RepID=A0A494YYR1_9BACL|nr:Crp/Fnr family transcriptional regulator [Lysinibacillus endophyticus]MCP1146581.1 Crp/Fnr family transcriptional regulator [Lysinibacillus endophyticus]RKQ15302.1 Crp/Fnr family transcriptional regulator [Lysinibacillus endophyticus]
MNLEKFYKIYNYQFRNDIISKLQLKTYKENECILKTGDEIDGLYFLIEGKYYVSSLEITGKELLLRYSKKPSILGDIEIFEQCKIQSNCIAAENCEFIFVPLHIYNNYLKSDSSFTHLLLKEMAYKLKTCTISSRVNALSPVSVRLAAYYCTIESSRANSEYITTNNLDEIASLIGTTKRHLNRILKQWNEEGTIHREGDKVQVLNWGKVKLYSNDVRFE